MDDEGMSLAQLEKLENNPHYKMSEKQRARMEALRKSTFKHNTKFAKHPTGPEEENGQSDSN